MIYTVFYNVFSNVVKYSQIIKTKMKVPIGRREEIFFFVNNYLNKKIVRI